jgi:hypothetical protein
MNAELYWLIGVIVAAAVLVWISPFAAIVVTVLALVSFGVFAFLKHPDREEH